MNAERLTLGIVTIAPRPRGGDLAATRGCRSCARAGARAEENASIDDHVATGADPSMLVASGLFVAVGLGILGLAGYGAYQIGSGAWGGVAGGVGGVAALGGALILGEAAGDGVATVTGLGALGLAGYEAHALWGAPGLIGVGAGVAAAVATAAAAVGREKYAGPEQ